jgi:GNAT superfamily N-acetyltransferase
VTRRDKPFAGARTLLLADATTALAPLTILTMEPRRLAVTKPFSADPLVRVQNRMTGNAQLLGERATREHTAAVTNVAVANRKTQAVVVQVLLREFAPTQRAFDIRYQQPVVQFVAPHSERTVDLTMAPQIFYADGLASSLNKEPHMSDSIQIRPVVRGDFDAWLPLWDAYNAFYGRSGETALPREITQITWERFFDGYEPMHAMVAERNGQLLGLVHFLYHRHTTMKGPICYLQDLYTLDTERGNGVGRALIEAVYERAKADGSQRVYWQTHETNQTAMKLYDKVADRSGFVVYRKAL